jgi:hypothetical protein
VTSNAFQSGRALPHSKTWRRHEGSRPCASVLECGCPLPLSQPHTTQSREPSLPARKLSTTPLPCPFPTLLFFSDRKSEPRNTPNTLNQILRSRISRFTPFPLTPFAADSSLPNCETLTHLVPAARQELTIKSYSQVLTPPARIRAAPAKSFQPGVRKPDKRQSAEAPSVAERAREH